MKTILVDTANAKTVGDSVWIECHEFGRSGAILDKGDDTLVEFGQPELADWAKKWRHAYYETQLKTKPEIFGMVTPCMIEFLHGEGYTTLKEGYSQSANFAVFK